MKRLLALAGLPLLLAPVPAWPATPGTVYEIEVLVFENRLPTLEAGELWIHNVSKPEMPDFAEATTPAGPAPENAALAAAGAALQKDGSYRVLAHLRWRQPAEAKADTKPVRIASTDGAFEGALRFYLSRFLHAKLELLLREARGGGLFGSGAPETRVYRIAEHRRIKTAELNYFDHPKFGALVRVVQVAKE